MSRQTNNQNLPRIEFQVHFRTGQHGRKHLIKGPQQNIPEIPCEDLPRLTRLLALAHRWNRLIEESAVTDCAEIARFMGLSRTRVTQIMNLLHLAPMIQESILSGNVTRPIPERAVRSITSQPVWKKQYKAWQEMTGETLPILNQLGERSSQGKENE